MLHPCKLPAREPPRRGESLGSLVRRNVLAMGYDSVERLLRIISLPRGRRRLDQLHDQRTLETLGQSFSLTAEDLRPLTIHCFAPQLVLVSTSQPAAPLCDSKTADRYFQFAHVPVCPVCLAEDVPYGRLLWSFRPLSSCPDHHVDFIESCPDCGRRLQQKSITVQACGCGFDIRRAPKVHTSPRVETIACMILGWLNDERLPIPGLTAAATFWWLERIARAVERTPIWLDQCLSHSQWPQKTRTQGGWLSAAEILCDWPGMFRRFLNTYQQVDKYRSTSTGVGRSFGQLLRDADRLERIGFLEPAEVLRQFLLERFNHGHLSSKTALLRGPVHRGRLAERPWISQTEAARQLRLRPPAIARLCSRGALSGQVSSAGNRGRTIGVVSRDSVNRLSERLSTTLSTHQAGNRLGVDRHRVVDMIEAGILADAVRTQHGWRVPADTVMEFLAWLHGLPTLPQKRTAWCSCRDATRRYGPSGLTLTRLLSFVRDGRLPACLEPRKRTLNGLFVRQGSLAELLPVMLEQRIADQGYTLCHLQKRLIPGMSVKDSVLRKWIRAGLLSATRDRKTWQITAEAVEHFQATYCLAAELIRELGICRTTLSRWELSGRIQPVYCRRTHCGAGASLYLRRDLESLRGLSAASGNRRGNASISPSV